MHPKHVAPFLSLCLSLFFSLSLCRLSVSLPALCQLKFMFKVCFPSRDVVTEQLNAERTGVLQRLLHYFCPLYSSSTLIVHIFGHC